MQKFIFSTLTFFGFLFAHSALADISVYVLDSEGWADHITNGGHSVLVLSDICAESPTRLRPCTSEDGASRGVVVNKMQSLSAEKYNWIATPVEEFLYGAPSKNDAPLIVNEKMLKADEQHRYEEFYAESIKNIKNGEIPGGRWQKSVGALYSRTIYEYRLPGFEAVETQIMNALNSGPNKSDYNVILKNCADFVQKELQPFLHAAIGLNVNGGGIHSPKALAANLTRLGVQTPELHMQVIRHPQLAGTFSRSTAVMAPSENLYKNPFFLIPVGFFVPEIPIAALLLNEFVSPFHQEAQYEKSLSVEDKEKELGSQDEWSAFTRQFHDVVAAAKSDSALPAELRLVLATAEKDKDVSKKLMNYFSVHGEFSVKKEGFEMEIQLPGESEPRVAGMTRNTVASKDKQLGFLVLMADLGQTLFDKARVRTAMEDFKKDWEIFLSLRGDIARNPASADLAPSKFPDVSDELFDKLFPNYTIQCAVGRMQEVGADSGNKYGHALMYIQGACQDKDASYPKLAICPGTGAVVSLDSIYQDTSFVVLDGKDLMFDAGLAKEADLDQVSFDLTAKKAMSSGALNGVHIKNEFSSTHEGLSDEEYLARRSTKTDWAVSYARDAACVRIPMTASQVAVMVTHLNSVNADYGSHKKAFVWDEFTNNCVTLIRWTLAELGFPDNSEKDASGELKKPSFFQKMKLNKSSDLPIPGMNLVKNIQTVNDLSKIDTAEKVFADVRLRNIFLQQNTLPFAYGGTVQFLPMRTENNKLFIHNDMVFDAISSGNKTKFSAFLTDPEFATLGGNLNRVLARFREIQAKRSALPPDETTDLGKFATRYDAWVDAQVREIQAKIAIIRASQ